MGQKPEAVLHQKGTQKKLLMRTSLECKQTSLKAIALLGPVTPLGLTHQKGQRKHHHSESGTKRSACLLFQSTIVYDVDHTHGPSWKKCARGLRWTTNSHTNAKQLLWERSENQTSSLPTTMPLDLPFVQTTSGGKVQIWSNTNSRQKQNLCKKIFLAKTLVGVFFVFFKKNIV